MGWFGAVRCGLWCVCAVVLCVLTVGATYRTITIACMRHDFHCSPSPVGTVRCPFDFLWVRCGAMRCVGLSSHPCLLCCHAMLLPAVVGACVRVRVRVRVRVVPSSSLSALQCTDWLMSVGYRRSYRSSTECNAHNRTHSPTHLLTHHSPHGRTPTSPRFCWLALHAIVTN